VSWTGTASPWVGTGFTFGEATFVICWHYVGATLADDDEVYIAVGREGGMHQQEATRWLEEFADNARFAGTVLTDAHRLKRLMRRHDSAIYPGAFATWVFNPDKALCQQHRDSHGTTHPVQGTCRPLECGNVALSSDNIDALRRDCDQITEWPSDRACHPCSFIDCADGMIRSPGSSTATPRRPRPRDPPHSPVHHLTTSSWPSKNWSSPTAPRMCFWSPPMSVSRSCMTLTHGRSPVSGLVGRYSSLLHVV